MPWFLLFFAVPIIEMYLLITVAGYIDVLPTIGLVMLTAVIGVSLLKHQGLETLTRGIQKIRAGELPVQEMAEGLLLAVAGALLITPGFVTDITGFLILFPPSRAWIARVLLARVQVQGFHAHTSSGANTYQQGQEGEASSRTIEGEYQHKD